MRVLKLSSDSGESPNLIFKAETNCAVDLYGGSGRL